MCFLGALTVVIRHDDGAPTAGQSYNLTCTATLDGITGPPTIEWLSPSNSTVSNSSSVTVENMVMVNDSVYDRTLVFSRVLTSHGGQYTCWATLDQASAVTSTKLSVQSVCVNVILYLISVNFCSFLQSHSQPSPSHPTVLVFSMLALPSPSPAPFS